MRPSLGRRAPSVALLAGLCVWDAFAASQAREVTSLDEGWRFSLAAGGASGCPADSFPTGLEGRRCPGLQRQGRPEDGGPGTPEACRQACCLDPSGCSAWQWCPANATDCPSGACWLAASWTEPSACGDAPGWQGGARPPPVPPLQPGSPCSTPECGEGFDDSSWRALDVPHDFVVEGNATELADKSHGYLPYGIAWYRRAFELPASSKDSVVSLDFDGVMVRSEVWLNGVYLGGHESGYTPFRFDIGLGSNFTQHVHWGGSNLLVVRVDASRPDGWWYDGGGIYRHVSLTVAPAVHVAPWGVYAPAVLTGPIDHASSIADAELRPTVEVANSGASEASVAVRCSVLDASGGTVTSAEARANVSAGSQLTVSVGPLPLPGAALWSVDRPTLYTLVTEVTEVTGLGLLAGSADTVQTRFGVRTVRWSAEEGFFLNEAAFKILGTANHQDFPAVGVAVPDSLQAHRIRKMKELGSNAWRCAHNAPNVALLDAADEIGFLVWDENHRNGEEAEMEALLRRDRNHPSVVIWSACNEVLCNTDNVMADLARLKALVAKVDPLMGRVLSANDNVLNGPGTVLDVQGFDYASNNYDKWHADAPGIPSIGSEVSSEVSDRGEYSDDPVTGHVSAYDGHPSWGETSEVAWTAILTRPFIAGGFTWTGWDYRGEPTPYQWPDTGSHFGILDAAGFPKDRAFWYQACWAKPDPPVLHLLPHWNWDAVPCRSPCTSSPAGGREVEVRAYSNADEVELLLPNGTSLGRRAAGPCSHAAWTAVPFAPGQLQARAFTAGRLVATLVVETTGPPAAVRVSIKDGVGAEGLTADGRGVALVVAEVVDAQGRLVPTAANTVTFTAAGGAIVGTSSGDPASLVPNVAPERPAFHGLVMAVVRAGREPGALVVTASSPGLNDSSVSLALQPAGHSSAANAPLAAAAGLHSESLVKMWI